MLEGEKNNLQANTRKKNFIVNQGVEKKFHDQTKYHPPNPPPPPPPQKSNGRPLTLLLLNYLFICLSIYLFVHSFVCLFMFLIKLQFTVHRIRQSNKSEASLKRTRDSLE